MVLTRQFIPPSWKSTLSQRDSKGPFYYCTQNCIYKYRTTAARNCSNGNTRPSVGVPGAGGGGRALGPGTTERVGGKGGFTAQKISDFGMMNSTLVG